MRKIRDILICILENRFSRRATARCIGVSRTTVSDCLTRFAAAGLTWPLPPGIDQVQLENMMYPSVSTKNNRGADIDFSIVHELLKRKGATLSVIHDEYCIENEIYDPISYSHYCRRYKVYKKTLRISLRQSYFYGELALVDYAGKTMIVTDPITGEQRTAQIFIGVLGGSNYTFCEATWSQKSEDWLASHVRMFEFFDGVPEVVVHDNLKSAVTKANRWKPIINESYKKLCDHYNARPFAARAYKPKDKAKAEAAVLLVERWILFRLRNRVFFSLTELNDAIRALLHLLNNKAFQKLPGSRFSWWSENEKSCLKPLPDQYEIATFGKARAGTDYLVTIDGHGYSVPCQMRGQEFDFRLTATAVDILQKGKCITTHIRSYVRGKFTVHKQHRTEAHAAIAEWSLEESLEWAKEIGPNTHEILNLQLDRQNVHLFGYRLVIAMEKIHKIHGSKRMEEACSYALKHKIIGTDELRQILTKNLDRLFASDVPDNLEREASNKPTLSAHENIRGADYYQEVLQTEDDV